MTRPGRIAAIVAGSFVAVAAVVAATFLFAFPAERVGEIAASRASTALGREIEVGSVRLRLWPVPAVALEGVVIGDRSGSSGAVARVDLRPRILPLLRGEVRVRSIIVDRPILVLEIDPNGQTTQDPPASDGPGFWDDATFEIERISITDGLVEYRDLATGGVARIEGIDQEVRIDGRVQDGSLASLALVGRLSANRIDADLPGVLATPIRGLRVAVEHDASVDMILKDAVVDQLALTVQEVRLEGSGTVESWSDPAARQVSLRLSTGDADLTPLLASLPEALRSWPAGAAAGEEWTASAGRARLEAVVDGRFGDGELPEVDGNLVLDGVALARGGDPVATELGGRITFSMDSASTSNLSGRVLGEPLALAFAVHDLAAPVVSATIETRLDLGRAAAVGLLPAGWTARGATGIDLVLAGPATEPAAITVDGTVTLGGISLRSPEWPAGLDLGGGTLEFGGPELVGRDLSLDFGGTDLAVDFALANWLPFALGDTAQTTRLIFEAASRRADLDELFPADPAEPTYGQLFFAHLANTPVNGRSAANAAEEFGFGLPELPAVEIEGQYHADGVRLRGLEYQGVDLQMAASHGRIEIRNADFRLFGGDIQIAARLGAADASPEADARNPFEIDFRVGGVGAQQFLERFTALRERIDGELRLDGGLSMVLDDHLLPDPTTLAGSGDFAAAGGRLDNWSIVRALGEQLGLTRFDSISFRDWGAHFNVVGSRIYLSETTMEAGNLSFVAAGSFDVAGNLDLAGTVHLGPDLTSRVGGRAAALTSAVSGPDGRVPVGIRISGSTRSVSVALDLSEAGSRLAEQARERAEAEVRERATEIAESVIGADRIPRIESPAAALDSARQRVGDAVTDRLRGILRPPAAPPAPVPAPAPAPAAVPPADATPSPDSATAVVPDSAAV